MLCTCRWPVQAQPLRTHHRLCDPTEHAACVDCRYLCTEDPRSEPVNIAASGNVTHRGCETYNDPPSELGMVLYLPIGTTTLWLALREQCALAKTLTLISMSPPSPPPMPTGPQIIALAPLVLVLALASIAREARERVHE